MDFFVIITFIKVIDYFNEQKNLPHLNLRNYASCQLAPTIRGPRIEVYKQSLGCLVMWRHADMTRAGEPAELSSICTYNM